MDVNTADYSLLIRIPGIGLQSAKKIAAGRRFTRLSWELLQKMGVVISRARYFILCNDLFERKDWQAHQIKAFILGESSGKYQPDFSPQLSMF